MLEAILRKTRRLFEDPVLRRWTIGVALGRYSRPGPFVAHRPRYTEGLPFPHRDDAPDHDAVASFGQAPRQRPHAPMMLALSGIEFVVTPDAPEKLFEQAFTDTEVLLAVHRFAWLPLAGPDVDPNWVDALWRLWLRKFSEPDASWAWHPYTAAERAINILDFSERHGLPGVASETIKSMSCHAEAIAQRLEYFGEHNTSNHLSNNGRGLYRIGLALGLRRATDLGRAILQSEADRLFGAAGLLREGSTHYHLLLSRNYVDVWLAAERAGRPEAGALKKIAERCLAALTHLALPGGFPLVGDISPDCPPDFLMGLLPGAAEDQGWCELLTPASRQAIGDLKRAAPQPTSDEAAADGWIRVAHGDWALLCHAPPSGWPQMPGHAHQDFGSFEAHWADIALIVDPGRGAYGESGEAAFYTTAAAHNGMTIDDSAPYPWTKPYYDAKFRHAVCGPDPIVERGVDHMVIIHNGFSRLADIGEARRSVAPTDASLVVVDQIAGSGSHVIQRRLHTPWPVSIEGKFALIHTPAGIFRAHAGGPVQVIQSKRWTAYGKSEVVHVITAEARMDLPARATFTIERLSAA